MTQRDDVDLEKYLQGESRLSELYKGAQEDGPSAELDQKILAKAQQALTPGAALPARKPRPAWLVPLSVAATVVLGVNLAFNLKDFRPEAVYSETGYQETRSNETRANKTSNSETGYDETGYDETGYDTGGRTMFDRDQAGSRPLQHPVVRTPESHSTQTMPAIPRNVLRGNLHKDSRSYSYPLEAGKQRAAELELEGLRSAQQGRNEQRKAQQTITKAIERSALRDSAGLSAATATAETDDRWNTDFVPPPLPLPVEKTLRENSAPITDERPRALRRQPDEPMANDRKTGTIAARQTPELASSESGDYPALESATKRFRRIPAPSAAAPSPPADLEQPVQQYALEKNTDSADVIANSDIPTLPPPPAAPESHADNQRTAAQYVPAADSDSAKVIAGTGLNASAPPATDPELPADIVWTAQQYGPQEDTDSADAFANDDTAIEELVMTDGEHHSRIANQSAAPGSTQTPVIWCDLRKPGIRQVEVRRARQAAQDAVPPLTAQRWIAHIRQLANERAYQDACGNLAAYIETFGRAELPDDMPVRLPD